MSDIRYCSQHRNFLIRSFSKSSSQNVFPNFWGLSLDFVSYTFISQLTAENEKVPLSINAAGTEI